MLNSSYSIVIPAKNEAERLELFLPDLVAAHPEAEIIVVDDGSEDDTAEVARRCGALVLSHPYSKGNGAAIKTGARAASKTNLLFMDGDGQHQVRDVTPLLAKLEEGYDLVVGAREGLAAQASFVRWGANNFYNWLSSWMVGHEILDLTSGMRAARREYFLEVLYLLPNGFSYPTTSTMAFYRMGRSVVFVPIECAKREGKSHVKLWRDGVRFLLIIFKIGTLYSPLKLFLPIAVLIFGSGIGYYAYTYMTAGRFTNMSMLLILSSLIIFLIGLVSEQVSNLTHKD
jgi:glycosyltransferase involved in cell wall biosynthesis